LPDSSQLSSSTPSIGSSRAVPFTDRISKLPWWAIAIALLGVLFAWSMATDQDYVKIFGAIAQGLTLTINVTFIAYALALVMGLLIALARVSQNAFIYNVSTFYVEIIRGLPTLVLLLYVAFVLIPGLIDGLNKLGAALAPPDAVPNLIANIGTWLVGIKVRQIPDVTRVIIALAVAYSAFVSEIFRAGIISVDRGQMEAARALGMTYWQAMRYVILRQAIRQALPPLGNDFIAMLKDSSLVSALGVRDITLQGKLYEASTFLTFKTYNVVAYLYLVMTLLLSLVVKWIEQRMSRERSRS
jgi:polar amino acid transport system permease protein